MPSYNTAKSQEYWTGWILAYYQWENGKTFEMIDKEIPICKIRNMYNPYHEMDISSAILKLREMSQVSRAETYLKNYAKGWYQSEHSCGRNRHSCKNYSTV